VTYRKGISLLPWVKSYALWKTLARGGCQPYASQAERVNCEAQTQYECESANLQVEDDDDA